MKILILLFAALTLTSCVAPEKTDDKKNDPAGKPTNVTDYSVCGNFNRSVSLQGIWHMDQIQNEFKLRTSLTIQGNQAAYSNQCFYQGRSLVATASSYVSYDNVRFSFLSSDSDETYIDEPDFKMSCSISIEPANLTYSFQGNCLVLNNGSSTLKLVPER